MPTVLFVCTANYYRSRFAEHFFNHLAGPARCNWTATSRGVATELGVGNVGPISPYAVQGLEAREVVLPRVHRAPVQLTEGDLQAADRVIVLDDTEHRPFMETRFTGWADTVTYWQVGDLHLASAEDALALMEQNIRSFVAQLTTAVQTP